MHLSNHVVLPDLSLQRNLKTTLWIAKSGSLKLNLWPLCCPLDKMFTLRLAILNIHFVVSIQHYHSVLWCFISLLLSILLCWYRVKASITHQHTNNILFLLPQVVDRHSSHLLIAWPWGHHGPHVSRFLVASSWAGRRWHRRLFSLFASAVSVQALRW